MPHNDIQSTDVQRVAVTLKGTKGKRGDNCRTQGKQSSSDSRTTPVFRVQERERDQGTTIEHSKVQHRKPPNLIKMKETQQSLR